MSCMDHAQEKEKIAKEVVKQENAVTAMQAIARAPSGLKCSNKDSGVAFQLPRWKQSPETVACPCHAKGSEGIKYAATSVWIWPVSETKQTWLLTTDYWG